MLNVYRKYLLVFPLQKNMNLASHEIGRCLSLLESIPYTVNRIEKSNGSTVCLQYVPMVGRMVSLMRI
jgi:hypothetical protein